MIILLFIHFLFYNYVQYKTYLKFLFSYEILCTLIHLTTNLNFSSLLVTEKTKNQLASPKEFLACKTKNIEICSNDLYLRGTSYNAVFNNPSVNEIFR